MICVIVVFKKDQLTRVGVDFLDEMTESYQVALGYCWPLIG